MVVLPIDKKLKKRVHRSVALAQDVLVMELYDNFSRAVIHGGTPIWRCYGSNRFSEDIDIYLPSAVKKAGLENLVNGLKEKGFVVAKLKRTDSTVFGKFSYLGVSVRFEAIFRDVRNFATMPFEMTDGSSILVRTLSPGEMIVEKVSAYVKRRKVRDFYDIFFLLQFVEERREVKHALVRLVDEFARPLDEKELKALIISGGIPTVQDMLEAVRKWVR